MDGNCNYSMYLQPGQAKPHLKLEPRKGFLSTKSKLAPCAPLWKWLALSPADQDRFICIYPAYLNNKKTIAEGKHIPLNKSVENPAATEIQDVCLAVGLNAFLEKNKMYSREWNRDVQCGGRVWAQLKQEDGSLCLVEFPSRNSVMLYAEEMIPKLNTRTQKTGGGDQSLQQGEGSKKGKGKKKK
ncbi:PREDICTED: signal recognition particle 19 kDa protein-like [Chrysochloris asiatica]|uniref:Signal recognition particle 19 kDa protein n=1 Tax=Chrysochloris asiatica TaxID=185453 RepID=A0A9B0U1R5_CHRAS|nr:PREDICTED: signal recognition particle 19 kDa protein-like [Chrysochloris asiatica]